jgi:D-alanyl-D-alanine dipeptidase
MEYDSSKDSSEERKRKREALMDKYREKGFLEEAKNGLKEWWEFQQQRRKGNVK